MSQLGNVPPTDGAYYAPIPAGKYVCEMIDHTDPTPAKSGQGNWVKVIWKVIEGEHAGRLIFQRINYQHSNPQAQEIGIKELGQIAFACGHNGVNFDLSDCHNIPCLVTVGVKEDPTGQYEPQNVVRRVEKIVIAPASSPAGQPPKGSPSAPGASAPWR